MINLGQQLRNAREKKGWSIRQLATYSKVPLTSLSDFERGVGDLPTRKAIRAFETLGLHLEFQDGKPSVSTQSSSNELEMIKA